ncbi:MAG: 4-hydroxy-3-methylbut-2-enyl diphosphate reductase [Planctomycetota bacterium]
MTMRILRARIMGMCFGVQRAIALARDLARGEEITVLGELVHNRAVNAWLEAQGVHAATNLVEVRTRTVLVSAHGASARLRARAAAAGHRVADATCPLVRRAQDAVKAFARAGFHPVVVGVPGHAEVRALTEDLLEFDVVASVEDVEHLVENPRLGVVAQTTRPVERLEEVAAAVRRRFPRSLVRVADTVCRATRERQEAAREIARISDAVVVVGDPASNNTREMAGVCRALCPRVHRVEGPDEILTEGMEGVETAGLTAGASTPADIVDAVEKRIWECGMMPKEVLESASRRV